MEKQSFNCPSCGASEIQIVDDLSYCLCPYCKTKYVVERNLSGIYLKRFDHLLAELVNGNQYLLAKSRLTDIDKEIDAAQQAVDEKKQMLDLAQAQYRIWLKKRQDREFYVLLGNGVLILLTFFAWYQVVFKLEGQVWGIGALIAMGLSVLIILLYIVYYIAHKGLPGEQTKKALVLEQANEQMGFTELQLNDLIIEKELCLYWKNNYHVRAAPTN